MRRERVTSSTVAEIGYDEGQRTLEVLFHTGTLYQYFEVPPHVFTELRQAGSLGQYLNANVKGHFRYARV
jgi:hypothetical protein